MPRHAPLVCQHLENISREGQRFSGQAIELFILRPAFNRPGENVEESLAKMRYVRSQGVWRIFWKRADGQWHGYRPCAEAKSLTAPFQVIHQNTTGAFFG